MNTHDFHFGKVIILHDNIAEVIINEGIEMSIDMINEYHDFLLKNLKAPFAILVNKIHSYTYSFEAQMHLLNLEQLKALGVVSYTQVSEMSTKMLHSMPRAFEWNLKIFKDRDKAYDWLCEQQGLR